MPVTTSYPGVYVQEVPSGVRTIAGVGTSIAAFVGAAAEGPLFRPVECLSYADFERTFTGDASHGQMPYYVKLFFMNGGTRCYVMRIANGASAPTVVLKNEKGDKEVLKLTAKVPGLAGQSIRAVVMYAGSQPEATFNINLFRWVVQGDKRIRKDSESWKNLTMDPNSPRYAETFLTQNSKLVDAQDLTTGSAPPGFSQSGRPVTHPNSADEFANAWKALIGDAVGTDPQCFQISVAGSPYVEPDLCSISVSAGTDLASTEADLAGKIGQRIQDAFTAKGIQGRDVEVSFQQGPDPKTGVSTLLRIAAKGTGDVYLRPAAQAAHDIAVRLMLGTEQGGVEVSAYAEWRPAPNGISFRAFDPDALKGFGTLPQDQVTSLIIEGRTAGFSVNLQTAADSTEKMFVDAAVNSPNGHSDGLREKLRLLAAAVNAEAEKDPPLPWTAEVAGSRLTLYPRETTDDNMISTAFATAPTDLASHFTNNVKCYTLGQGGHGIGLQTLGDLGSDGVAPRAGDYDEAYRILDKEVDLFNLLILPPNQGALAPIQDLYGAASTFCQGRRAFLLMDPPESWADAQTAAAGVKTLRQGLVKDYAAVFYPRVIVADNGRRINIGPSGAVAGVMARIDGTRGVWKAPAGVEADVRGIVGLERQLSDGENGTINPRAINALRVFPDGIVAWGARTMAGDDDTPNDYKYIPVRRLALFIEESLYRGLTWVVFEPNDEPLWAQIRLNAGAFMHDLFRKGAFQGKTPQDAYFVKCDGDTTTQTDRNLGMVNIWVGFAPLKPAEFVIIYLQQMAGQIEV
jgi:phage tail sheath protein FI